MAIIPLHTGGTHFIKKFTVPMLYAVFIDARLVCAASTLFLKCIQRMLPLGKKKKTVHA